MGKMKEHLMDQYDQGYKNGYHDAVHEMVWECSDCGNKYDPLVTTCPNEHLHKAILGKHNV